MRMQAQRMTPVDLHNDVDACSHVPQVIIAVQQASCASKAVAPEHTHLMKRHDLYVLAVCRAGAAAYLPFLHLHWYVYSLATPVTWAFHDPKMTHEPLTGHGFAHMEKNWGRTFPDKWVWAQGLRLNRQGSRQCSESPSDDPEVGSCTQPGQTCPTLKCALISMHSMCSHCMV